MVKVWIGKNWKDELKIPGGAYIQGGKRHKYNWYNDEWPPVKVVVMSEEEYQNLDKYRQMAVAQGRVELINV